VLQINVIPILARIAVGSLTLNLLLALLGALSKINCTTPYTGTSYTVLWWPL